MSEPLVVAVMLAAGRAEMVRQAVASFSAQTYEHKLLVVCDSGELPALELGASQTALLCHRTPRSRGKSIGVLRNQANTLALAYGAEIICHWDSDDWSHPRRIEEQVALLTAAQVECVGYNELLVWRVIPQSVKDGYAEVQRRYPSDPNVAIPKHLQLCGDEAWLFTSEDLRQCVGTSLCYLASTWQRQPFRDLNKGEDSEFHKTLKRVAESSLIPKEGWPLCWSWDGRYDSPQKALAAGSFATRKPQALISAAWADTLKPGEPRMIARLHGANTELRIVEKNRAWRRAPEFDAYCQEVFA